MNPWNVKAGWLSEARRVDSPNANERPSDATVDLLVIHNISLPPGEFGGDYIEALFTNALDPEAHEYFADVAHLTVSAHFLVRRNGEVVQFVSTDERAWHAGDSLWFDRANCNDFSVGIEVEGADDVPYAEEQYNALAKLIRALWEYYPTLAPDAMVGHSDIAPERKTDPGSAFDWQKLRQLLSITT